MNLKNINVVRSGRGRFTLYVNGQALTSQYDYESTGIEAAINHLIAHPNDEVELRQELKIRIEGEFDNNEKIIEKTEFVSVQNGQFYKEGTYFYGAGTNAYYLPNYEILDSGVVDRAFDAFEQSSVSIIRMWGFYDGPAQYPDDTSLQPEPGVYNEEGFKALDRVIAKGKERGMVFVLPLLNNWAQLGGVPQYCKWAEVESSMNNFINSPFAQTTYKDYIEYVLNRVNSVTGIAYKDEPAIHSWQICNEGRNPNADPEELHDWYQHIAQFIKEIDPNHLVGTGEEGFDDASQGIWTVDGNFTHPGYASAQYSNTYVLRANQGTSFALNIAIPEIDYGNFHWYPEAMGWGSQDMLVTPELLKAQSAWLKDHANMGFAYSKPVLLGEYGFPGWGDERVIQCYAPLWVQAEKLGIPTLLWQLTADYTKCSEYGGNICYPGGRVDTALFEAFKAHCLNMNNLI